MSKTFKTAHADNKVLKVDSLFGNPRLLIKEFDGDTRGFAFAQSDAAELMLAIGDMLPVPDTVREGSYEHFLGNAIHYLAKAVKAQESDAAEAKEQAELEAEALELFRASQCIRTDGMYASVPSFAALSDPSKTKWLAVARRARELAKEATK